MQQAEKSVQQSENRDAAKIQAIWHLRKGMQLTLGKASFQMRALITVITWNHLRTTVMQLLSTVRKFKQAS
jgi:hypothetical protein